MAAAGGMRPRPTARGGWLRVHVVGSAHGDDDKAMHRTYGRGASRLAELMIRHVPVSRRVCAGVHGDRHIYMLHDLSGAGAMTDDVSQDPLQNETHTVQGVTRTDQKSGDCGYPFLRMPPRLPKVAIR